MGVKPGNRIVQVKAYHSSGMSCSITSVIETQIDITEKQKAGRVLHHALKMEAIGRSREGGARLQQHDGDHPRLREMLLSELSPRVPWQIRRADRGSRYAFGRG